MPNAGFRMPKCIAPSILFCHCEETEGRRGNPFPLPPKAAQRVALQVTDFRLRCPADILGDGAPSSPADRGAPRSESRINMIAGGNHTLIYALAAPLLHLPPAAQRLAALQGRFIKLPCEGSC